MLGRGPHDAALFFHLRVAVTVVAMTPSNRAGLLALLSFPVVIGIVFAVRLRPYADNVIAWLLFAEIVFLISMWANANRQEHHLTWRAVLPHAIRLGVFAAIVIGGFKLFIWLLEAIQRNWQTVGPILVLIGLGVAALVVLLLVLYLVVRVVRAAWKGS